MSGEPSPLISFPVNDEPATLKFNLNEDNYAIFPLQFCPDSPNGVRETCDGKYGIVFKEWETITRVITWLNWSLKILKPLFISQIYPKSAKYLNPATYQMDVDILDNLGNKVKIAKLDRNIKVSIGRQKYKAKKQGN